MGTYIQLTPGDRSTGGGSSSGLQDVSDTNSLDLVNSAGTVSGNVKIQNSSTVVLSSDSSGLKAEVQFDPYNAQDITISVVDINNGYIILDKQPTVPSLVRVIPLNGIEQFAGVDFNMTADNGNKRLSWVGEPLEALVEIGMKITVIYT